MNSHVETFSDKGKGTMLASELRRELEEFQRRLEEHRELWGNSLNSVVPGYPVRNGDELQVQCRWLSRKMGQLRPFFERFVPNWIMRHPATGVVWDVLETAVGMEAVAQAKGPSIRTLSQRIDQILGELDTYDDNDEIPRDADQPVRSGIGLGRLMIAYLPQLHAAIAAGCSQLFINGHYAQAVEEAAKAVPHYIREVTGLPGDGAALVDRAFSTANPTLAFSDLSDESKRNEHIGFMEMLKGFHKGVRHPLAHSHGREEQAHKAFEYLVMASLFCRRIDDASPGGESDGSTG